MAEDEEQEKVTPLRPDQASEALGDIKSADYAAAVAKLPEDQQKAMRALEQETADKIKELSEKAREKEEKDSFGGDMFDVDNLAGRSPEDQIKAELRDLPPAMREAVVARLAAEKEKGESESEGDGQIADGDRAAKLLEEVVQDEADDKERAERRRKKIEDGVGAAEAAAKAGDEKGMSAALDKMTAGQREDALEKMSDEAREAAEEQLELRRKRLEKAAETLAEAADGAGTGEIAIIKTFSGLSPTEAEELEEIYGEMKDSDGKKRNLRKEMREEFNDKDGEKKEREFITAVLDGDSEAKELGVDLAVKYIEDEAGAFLDSDEGGINDLLRAHADNPESMERIASAYKKSTGKDLTSDLKDIMDEQQLKESTAYQRCDKASADVAILEQGDGERSEMVVAEAREDGELGRLATDTQNHTGQKLDQVLDGQLSPETSAEINEEVAAAQEKITEERDKKLDQALVDLKADKDPEAFKKANIKAEALAGKLATELGKGHYVGNNFEVTDCLQGLSPAEVKLVMDHYKTQQASVGKDGDLEADLRGKLQGKDLKVANAVLSGDPVLASVAFVEQAADGGGTNLESWKKAMDALEKPEDRQRFQDLMDQHVGGIKGSAYKDMTRSESSSFDRDELEAKAIVDENERAGALAQVQVSRNAYGGQYTQIMEGLDDSIGDMTGQSDAQRRERRQQRRENDVFMMASNLGGSEEPMLDAVEGLKNPEQIAAFKARTCCARTASRPSRRSRVRPRRTSSTPPTPSSAATTRAACPGACWPPATPTSTTTRPACRPASARSASAPTSRPTWPRSPTRSCGPRPARRRWATPASRCTSASTTTPRWRVAAATPRCWTTSSTRASAPPART